MTAKKIVIALGILAVLAGPLALAQEKSKDQTLYDSAKASIYQKDYKAAVAAFNELINAYTKSTYYAESLYWLGYSLDKQATSLENLEKGLEMKKDAFDHLNTLVTAFPDNSWAKDAKILRVQVAEALAEAGLKDYRKYIDDSVTGGARRSAGVEAGVEAGVKAGVAAGRKETDPELELKLVALDALLQMDANKAYPILEKMVREGKDDRLRDRALFVLSQHDDPKITPLLTEIAMKDASAALREKAIFWLGQRDGEESFAALVKIYDSATDTKLKEKLIFAIGQNGSAKARTKLVEIAKTDKDASAREKAIFWIGQGGGKDAAAILLDIYKSSTDAKVKKQVIFAIAQESDKAVPTLIEMARKETDLELKKQLIFWLGQSNSPEAAKFLKEIIDK